MAPSIKCPHCAQVMKVSDNAAGKRVDCPACKKAFLAPKGAAKPAKPSGPPPVASSNRVWYVHVDGRNDGPHTSDNVVEQIKTGRLDAHSLAWKEGMGDWEALGDLKEFHGAVATPPPVGKSRAHRKHETDDEPHQRYSRAKARRDITVGLWVAGVLTFGALIALIVVLNRKDKDSRQPPKPPPVFIVEQPSPPTPGPTETPKTPTPAGKKSPPPKKGAELSNSKVMAALVADLDKGFKDAIEGHKRADARPILKLTQACKKHSDQLGERDWGAYKNEVETVAKRLGEASTGINTTLRERAEAWGLGDGLDDKKKAEILGLNKYDWLERWQKTLSEEIEKVKKKGLAF